MLGALTEQLVRCFDELMEELRGIREELALVRTVLEQEQPHPALRPVKPSTSSKKSASARGK